MTIIYEVGSCGLSCSEGCIDATCVMNVTLLLRIVLETRTNFFNWWFLAPKRVFSNKSRVLFFKRRLWGNKVTFSIYPFLAVELCIQYFNADIVMWVCFICANCEPHDRWMIPITTGNRLWLSE